MSSDAMRAIAEHWVAVGMLMAEFDCTAAEAEQRLHDRAELAGRSVAEQASAQIRAFTDAASRHDRPPFGG